MRKKEKARAPNAASHTKIEAEADEAAPIAENKPLGQPECDALAPCVRRQ